MPPVDGPLMLAGTVNDQSQAAEAAAAADVAGRTVLHCSLSLSGLRWEWSGVWRRMGLRRATGAACPDVGASTVWWLYLPAS
eukprot:1140332-Pelagomonas_calceolata.AAC.10